MGGCLLKSRKEILDNCISMLRIQVVIREIEGMNPTMLKGYWEAILDLERLISKKEFIEGEKKDA